MIIDVIPIKKFIKSALSNKVDQKNFSGLKKFVQRDTKKIKDSLLTKISKN